MPGYQRPTPSFDGMYIFGSEVKMNTVFPPREKQVNGFMGINGVEVIDLGMRMWHTLVVGVLYGETEYALGDVEQRFRSYINPRTYTLVTTEGISWDFVQMDSFEPVPPIQYDRWGGFVRRAYRAKFNHLRVNA